MLLRFLILVLFSTSIAFSQKGFVRGIVKDATNDEALVGVNILVNELENVGTVTNNKGNFELKLDYGSYSLRISYIGYQTLIKTDVIVTAGKETFLNLKLVPSIIQTKEAIVQADYFYKSLQINNLSTVILNQEEVRRSPGSMQDFQRILQGMAGVSFSNDQNNELIVRGGSPDENLTVLDEMELHSTNHYPNEYNSGGPINMINVDLIDNIQFSTGGFISKYGDKLSSVMQITTREGSRNKKLLSNLNLSMAGLGGIFEGSINNGKGSWIVSARKSYINLIAGSFGLTAIPYYYDFQTKVVYDLSQSQKISFSAIYGNDKILFDGENNSDLTKRNIIDSVSLYRVDVKQYQYAFGLTLKSIWSKNSFSSITWYYSHYNNKLNVDEKFYERTFDSDGNIIDKILLNKRPIIYDDRGNSVTALKGDFFLKLNEQHELNFGFSVGTGNYIQSLYLSGDTVRYLINGNWSAPIVVQPSNLKYNIKMFENFKYYTFINDKIKLMQDRLVMNIGLRYDYFSYSRKGNLSPRVNASFFIIPVTTSINFAYGEYYQTQSYPTYGDREKKDTNRYLKNSHARHFVLGIEQIIDDGLRLNLETYKKYYDDLPVSEKFIHFKDRTFRSNKILNAGKQTVTGIDLLIQQKLVKDYFGTLSYSRMWTEYEDPRIGYEGEKITSSYDFPHILTIIFGKRFSGLRTQLNRSNFIVKYLSYLLPFSDDMEISLRWRYASGKPYTEKYWVTSEQYFEGGVRWSNGNWVESEIINGKRYPDYHRLDIAFNSRYNFNNWSITVFLSIQNLYNRKNIAFYEYSSEGKKEIIYQIALLPVVGVDVRF